MEFARLFFQWIDGYLDGAARQGLLLPAPVYVEALHGLILPWYSVITYRLNDDESYSKSFRSDP